MQVELIRFRKKIATIDFGNFEVGIYIRDQRAHCYPLRVATGSGGAGRFGHDHFGTHHFGTFSIRYIVTSGHAQLGT